MSDELKELIEQQLSYYAQHDMRAWIDGDDHRLKSFIVEDFRALLTALEKELQV